MKNEGLFKITYANFKGWVCAECFLDVAKSCQVKGIDWKLSGKCSKCGKEVN